MPIEFSCPECATLIRTPDATAGKKGKCPGCAAIVRIPGGTGPVSTKPAAAPPVTKRTAPPPQPAAEAVDTGPLEFFCSVCGQVVRTPRSAAGKKGKCPHCNGVIQIPLKSRVVKTNPPATNRPATTAVAPQAPKSVPKPTPKPARPQVDEVGMASLEELTPLPDLKPARKPASESAPSQPVHKPKNPNIPPSDSYLQPMPDLLDDNLLAGSDPFAVGGYGVAPDPLGGLGSGGGVNLPAASPFAPMDGSLAGGFPPALPGGPPGVPARRQISPIMVILPAIFQMFAIIPFLLLNMFVGSTMLYTFLVASSEYAVISTNSMALLLFYSMLLLLAFAIQVWAIFGSINMMQFRNYDNALASAWISLIPCFGFCGIPFGIWSLIVLYDRGVKKMFTNDD